MWCALCAPGLSRLSAVRPGPAGAEAGVRALHWGPRRAGARFCFRGTRTMPLPCWLLAQLLAYGIVCGASGVMWPL
jgi:hypothetical protein